MLNYAQSEKLDADDNQRYHNDSQYQTESLMTKARDQFALSQIDIEFVKKKEVEDEDDLLLADAQVTLDG